MYVFSLHLSLSRSLSFFLSSRPLHLCTHIIISFLSVDLSIDLSIYLSLSTCIHIYIQYVIYTYIYIYIYVYIIYIICRYAQYARKHRLACDCLHPRACMHACLHGCMYVCMYVIVCMYVCVCVSECLHVRRSLCLSVCVYVCMYVCAYRYTDVGMQSGTHLSATMALTLIHFRSTIYHLLQRCLLSRKVVVKLLGARGAWPGRTNVRLVRSLAIHLQKDIFLPRCASLSRGQRTNADTRGRASLQLLLQMTAAGGAEIRSKSRQKLQAFV